VQQLRSAVQLESKYATVILQALWERIQDRELVRTLAHGSSEEALWRIDGGKIAGGDSRECGTRYFASCFFTSNFCGE
jgi:hypothetical protein